MTGQTLRNLAIALLCDPAGINRQAWDILASLLDDAGYLDIIRATREYDNRFDLSRDDAARLGAIVIED